MALKRNPYAAPDENEPEDRTLEFGKPSGFDALRKIARLLWIAPLLVAIPVFYSVREFFPNSNDVGIANGFRKFNIFLSIVGPLALLCWFVAFLFTLIHDLRLIQKSRWQAWLVVFLVIMGLVIAIVSFDL